FPLRYLFLQLPRFRWQVRVDEPGALALRVHPLVDDPGGAGVCPAAGPFLVFSRILLQEFLDIVWHDLVPDLEQGAIAPRPPAEQTEAVRVQDAVPEVCSEEVEFRG